MSEQPSRHHVGMRREPWLVPGAIAFLRAHTATHPGCKVLEFGGGASTIWFLRQGCQVVAFEAKLMWRELIIDAAANRTIVNGKQAQRLDLREWQDDAAAHLVEWFGSDSFDIVLVDGLDRHACLKQSVPLVRPGGVLMMDNVGVNNLLPEWEWTCCVQGSRDKFNATHANWKPGWGTAWWQRPPRVFETLYFDVYCEHTGKS